jgi:hypothetical protein
LTWPGRVPIGGPLTWPGSAAPTAGAFTWPGSAAPTRSKPVKSSRADVPPPISAFVMASARALSAFAAASAIASAASAAASPPALDKVFWM